jgi:hypothetical protein
MSRPAIAGHCLRVALCSTSAGAHVLAGVLAPQPGVDVSVFTLNPAKAWKWRRILEDGCLTTKAQERDGSWSASTTSSFGVTSNPEKAGRGCDMVILAVPAFLHTNYLAALAPYLEDGCVIVGLPGHCGFELEVRHVLTSVLRCFTIVNFDALPWVARVSEFGRTVTITATKDVLVGAMQPDPVLSRVADPLTVLQGLLGSRPQLVLSGHPLGITLRAPNASVHPPVMYSRWKDWDGLPLAEAPGFYTEIDELAAGLIAGISRECTTIAQEIMVAHPEADLLQVISAHEWELDAYGPLIADKTSLMAALRTNSAHAGARHPMTEIAPGQFAPDFGHRFLAEDIPFGLVVVRGIAEIAAVETPTIDLVLAWSQERLGRRYLTGAGFDGADIASSRAPQRYGLTTLHEVLGFERHRIPALSVP